MNIEDINSLADANVFIDAHLDVMRVRRDGSCAWEIQGDYRNVVSLKVVDVHSVDVLEPTQHSLELREVGSNNLYAAAAWIAQENHHHVRALEKKYVLPVPCISRATAVVRQHDGQGVSYVSPALLVVMEVRTLNARPPNFFNTGTLNPHYTPDFLSHIAQRNEGHAHRVSSSSSSSPDSSDGDEVDRFFEQHRV